MAQFSKVNGIVCEVSDGLAPIGVIDDIKSHQDDSTQE